MPFKPRQPNEDTGNIFDRYEQGLHVTGPFQVSCYPWLTGSNIDAGNANQGEVTVSFPMVTKSFTIVNTGSDAINVHFASRESSQVVDGLHYMTIPGSSGSWTYDVKCTKLYVSSFGPVGDTGFLLSAELTGIPTDKMPALTGSGIDE